MYTIELTVDGGLAVVDPNQNNQVVARVAKVLLLEPGQQLQAQEGGGYTLLHFARQGRQTTKTVLGSPEHVPLVPAEERVIDFCQPLPAAAALAVVEQVAHFRP